jgi:hypothetical protein
MADMGRCQHDTKQGLGSRIWLPLAIGAALALSSPIPGSALADEGGVSFWLPGLYGSLSAVPGTPGWSVNNFYYFTDLSAGADVSRSREFEIGRLNPTINLNLRADLSADTGLLWVNPVYVFARPVLGGQASLGVGGFVGDGSARLNGTLTASLPPFSLVRSDSISDTVLGFGDLYPQATLKWNRGVDNFMIYGTGDIPVGDYSSTDLANLGIGHGALDGGAGYTYLDQKTGREFSAVAGFTYNLQNPSTDYQNGVDFHLDWGASQFLSKQLLVGAVGYVYQEVGCDSGSGDHVGCFQSRVISVGPQIGYIYPVGDMQGYVNLKGYGEFDAQDRPSGFNVWLTFALSPAPAAAPK